MADTEQEHTIGYTDKRRTQSQTKIPGTQGTTVNYNDVGALRARLTAVAAASYPATRLNTMTKNDMVYALRLADDAAGVR